MTTGVRLAAVLVCAACCFSCSGGNKPSGGGKGTGGATGGSGGDTASGGVTGGTTGAAGTGLTTGTTGTDNTAKTHGLGRPCQTDSDCNAPQTCRSDTQDYIADGQCTVPCQSDADCTGPFGDLSMCIGAGICVTKCLTDSECPQKTLCTSNDWCERTGPGSGVPYCSGTASACSLLTKTQCQSALGCTWSGGCTGVADDCYSLFDSYSCSGQDGCYWSSYSSSCSGSATPCDLLSSDLACTYQLGCNWATPKCSGTVLQTCQDTPVSLCADQPGCTVSQ